MLMFSSIFHKFLNVSSTIFCFQQKSSIQVGPKKNSMKFWYCFKAAIFPWELIVDFLNPYAHAMKNNWRQIEHRSNHPLFCRYKDCFIRIAQLLNIFASVRFFSFLFLFYFWNQIFSEPKKKAKIVSHVLVCVSYSFSTAKGCKIHLLVWLFVNIVRS